MCCAPRRETREPATHTRNARTTATPIASAPTRNRVAGCDRTIRYQLSRSGNVSRQSRAQQLPGALPRRHRHRLPCRSGGHTRPQTVPHTPAHARVQTSLPPAFPIGPALPPLRELTFHHCHQHHCSATTAAPHYPIGTPHAATHKKQQPRSPRRSSGNGLSRGSPSHGQWNAAGRYRTHSHIFIGGVRARLWRHREKIFSPAPPSPCGPLCAPQGPASFPPRSHVSALRLFSVARRHRRYRQWRLFWQEFSGVFSSVFFPLPFSQV